MSESVFLNLNTNFGNDTAFNYTQYFDNPLEIPANAEVALYNAELKKAPINLASDQQMTLFIDSSSDSTKADAIHNTDASLADNIQLENISITVPKGNYSKRSFLNKLQEKADLAISTYNSDSSKPRVPYQFCVRNEQDGVFAGLAPKFNNQDYKFLGTEPEYRKKQMEVTPAANVSVNITLKATGNIQLDGENGCKSWAMAQSGVNPLNFGKYQQDVMSRMQGDIFFNIVDDNEASTDQATLGCCFLSTKDIEDNKTSSNNLKCIQSSDLSEYIPKSHLGFQIEKNGGQDDQDILTVYANYIPDEQSGVQLNTPLKLYSAPIDSTIYTNRWGVSFYFENEVNPNDIDKNRYYFRIHAMTTSLENINTASGIAPTIVFDSKLVDYKIPKDLILDSFKYEQAGSSTQGFYKGLVPCFYVFTDSGRSLGSDTVGFADIRGNFIYDTTQSTVTNRDTVGLLRYSLTSLTNDLKSVLGNEEVKAVSPAGYDRVITPDFGVTELFGDTTNYNIEISNLPIMANQSTETLNNNIGTKRPIVFQVNNAFSGSLNQVNSGELIRSIYPPQLKFLKLNNVKPLKLNSLNVKIKRSKDNSVASELNDCKLELLIK
jgi:hypothetical protein